MSNNADRYYQPSGKIPFLGTVLMLGVGTLAALLSSFVYAVISRYNPLIYIQFFVTLFFGVALGVSVKAVAHATKVRNRFFSILISLVIGALGVYFGWVWYIYILAGWDRDLLIFNPTATFAIIQSLAENGIWEIRNAKPTGFVLYAFWLIEAGIVLAVCYGTGADMDTPFCEECNCWTEKRDALKIAKVDTALLREALEEEQYDLISTLAAGDIRASDHLSVECFNCPKCQDSGYLIVSSVKTTQGNDGPEVNVTQIIRPIAVPYSLTEEVEHLAKTAAVKEVSELAKEMSDDTPDLDLGGSPDPGQKT